MDYKFNLTVKSCVDRIFIYQKLPNNIVRFINEMIIADPESYEQSEIPRIFNGTLPMTLKKHELILRLLGDEYVTTYNFNNLFSNTLTADIFNDFKNKEQPIQKNFVIINAPTDFEYIIVEVPIQLQKYLKLPKFIFLIDAVKNKIKLFPDKTTNLDMLAKGIDPQGKTFISYLDIDLSYTLTNNLIEECLHILEDMHFTIKCYRLHTLKEFSFE
jgi:hypothetical protein